MKRGEVKTMLLLMFPTLAMLVFACILSLAKSGETKELPYRVTHNEVVVGANNFTNDEKSIAIYSKIPLNKVALHRVEVWSRTPSWSERLINRIQPTRAYVEDSSCIELSSGRSLPLPQTIRINNPGLISIAQNYYNLEQLRSVKGPLEFSSPLTWEKNGKIHKLKLTKKVLASELK